MPVTTCGARRAQRRVRFRRPPSDRLTRSRRGVARTHDRDPSDRRRADSTRTIRPVSASRAAWSCRCRYVWSSPASVNLGEGSSPSSRRRSGWTRRRSSAPSSCRRATVALSGTSPRCVPARPSGGSSAYATPPCPWRRRAPDDAGVGAGIRLALTAGDDLSVGDDPTGARACPRLPIEHACFPKRAPVTDVHRVDLVVGAAIDQRASPTFDDPGWCRR